MFTLSSQARSGRKRVELLMKNADEYHVASIRFSCLPRYTAFAQHTYGIALPRSGPRMYLSKPQK